MLHLQVLGFVTHHAEQQRRTTAWQTLSPTIFTFALVDNIDILQSHAAVYCGQQSRSYHGTTVQLVQPKPTLSFVTPSNVHTQSISDGNSLESRNQFYHHKPSDSPSSSPHKLGEVGPKRRRSVVVRQLTTSLHDSILKRPISHRYSSLSDKETTTELFQSKKPTSDIFRLMTMKVAASENDLVMPICYTPCSAK